MLEALITSKARIEILKLFYLNDESKFHIRQISRDLKLNLNQVSIELNKLSEAGFFEREKVGNVILFKVNKEHTLFSEISEIIKKSSGFEILIRDHLKKIKEIQIAFIFGSYAKGKIKDKSDIDILIIGEPNMDELNREINKIEKKLKRPIQYVVYPMKEFKEKRKYGFVKNIVQEKKIFLIGDKDGLE